MSQITRTRALASWASALKYTHLPPTVIARTKDFFADTLACAVAGRGHIAVTSMLNYAQRMGPSDGKCELIGTKGVRTSPAFAALVNGAAAHVVEQDDLHNSSMMHPATVIFPTALAVAQDVGASGKDFITACVVGYEVACRTGEYLGKAHYEKFHTTATTGVLGAAATTAHLLHLNTDQFISALGTAGTQSAGLWQFLLDATHSKQVHTAQACASGVFSAYTSASGLLGTSDILEGSRGMGATLGNLSTTPEAIDRKLGEKWSILESSFKWHASCRHTHPSADALIALMSEEGVGYKDIDSVKAYTYKAALDVLGLSGEGTTVHQSKFSMGFVLAVAAKKGSAGLMDFTEEDLGDGELRELQGRVSMVLDEEIDDAFPERWLGKVEVVTKDGRVLSRSVDVVKGDPGWTLTREEIESKALALADYGGVQDVAAFKDALERIWSIEAQDKIQGYSFA
ncbi:MmgE/PrpD family protein [Aspergillus stella-maris]|uniref:MmgE/PrpD family protein n=1 Tax=Aspergillus stella-maris TaxID=1810926 RepID=UPI003CCE027A